MGILCLPIAPSTETALFYIMTSIHYTFVSLIISLFFSSLKSEGSCTPKADSWRGGDCSKYVWACTDSRIPWYKERCSTTCNYCDPMPSNCGVENVPTSDRIQGGSFAEPNQYPWMVSLSGCGGSLISDRHVLTAYHCRSRHRRYAKVSVHDQYDHKDYQRVRIKSWVYPSKPHNRDHDIAIVILEKPVKFGKTIRPVCLPAAKDLVYDGETCLAMGWGRHTLGDHSQSRYLRKVPLEVEGTMRNKNYFTTFIRRNDANSVMEVCKGDSGGPLVSPGHCNEALDCHWNCCQGTLRLYYRTWREWSEYLEQGDSASRLDQESYCYEILNIDNLHE